MGGGLGAPRFEIRRCLSPGQVQRERREGSGRGSRKAQAPWLRHWLRHWLSYSNALSWGSYCWPLREQGTSGYGMALCRRYVKQRDVCFRGSILPFAVLLGTNLSGGVNAAGRQGLMPG
ncbi:hypothetical protein XENTR_v10019469 [Xenopus tropicalis]|nr:hypothetical protein XENTR_v10019469 [Xenopus tropicalis]